MSKQLPEIPADEKITWAWVRQHVPIKMWLQLLTVLAATFALGVSVGQVSVVRELFGHREIKKDQPLTEAATLAETIPARVDIVSDDLLIAVPIAARAVVPVKVRLDVAGQASFKKAKLKRIGVLSRTFFPNDADLHVEIFNLKPEHPSVRNMASSIVLDFDVSRLKPDRQAVALLKKGASTTVGRAYVELFYLDGNLERSQEIVIPITLIRQ